MMKHLKFIFSLFVVAIAFQACSSSDDSGDSAQPGTFQVDFNGQTYVADVVSATIIDDVINVTGLRGSEGENVTLTVFGSTEGTYQLGVTSNQVEVNGAAYIEPNNDGTGVFVALTDGVTSQGQLIITEIDETNLTISGTFEFTATNQNTQEVMELTNGVFFQIPYNDGLVGNDNTFFAKVDGNEFVEDSVNGARTTLAGSTTISISATKNNGHTIGLFFDGDVQPGTYDFGGFGGIPIAQYNLGTSELNIGSGTFTITSHDTANKRIVGTFEFTATPFGGTGTTTYAITEGSFDVVYF